MIATPDNRDFVGGDGIWTTHAFSDLPTGHVCGEETMSPAQIYPEEARQMIERLVDELHDPVAAERQSSVFLAFEDGEVCMTKAGSLFLRRKLHVIHPAYDGFSFGRFPVPYGDHRYAILPSSEAVARLTAILPNAYRMTTGCEPPTFKSRATVGLRRLVVNQWCRETEKLMTSLGNFLDRGGATRAAERLRRRWEQLATLFQDAVEFSVR